MSAKNPVETKVHVASVTAYLGSVGGLAILQTLDSNHALLGGLPAPLSTIVWPVIVYLTTFVGGYVAKHTPKPAASISVPAPQTAVVAPVGVADAGYANEPSASDDLYVTDVDTTADDE